MALVVSCCIDIHFACYGFFSVLRHLNEQLQKATVITDANKDFVVETLRSMAELLIWGDQHDPTFFDFFMEKQVMSTFVRILRESKTITAVAVQLLQTLSIMIQNITSKHARYYLFSNEHINQLITYPFDFQHEELLAYYIIFLRTISMKLDQNTVSFFIKTNHVREHWLPHSPFSVEMDSPFFEGRAVTLNCRLCKRMLHVILSAPLGILC
jgi:hypothetical protein